MSTRPEVGQMIEVSIWLTGTETEEHLLRFKSETIPNAFKQAEQKDRVVLGSVVFTEKAPGGERVPQVPAHISGPNVRLLVAEAPVLALTQSVIEAPGFVGDLTDEDVAALRRVTRAAYSRQHPQHPALTDRQCDSVINAMGPKAAVETLRQGRTVQ